MESVIVSAFLTGLYEQRSKLLVKNAETMIETDITHEFGTLADIPSRPNGHGSDKLY